MVKADVIEQLAKRRGFFWPAAEIYGGMTGFYDYGPLGAVIKRKFQDYWRDFFKREGFIEIETPTIMPKEVFVASRHLEKFVDPMTKCNKCSSVFRADLLLVEKLKMKREDVEGLGCGQLKKLITENKIKCPKCGSQLLVVELFNMMFKTTAGLEKEVYCRPETAQGHFIAFKRVFEIARKKFPLGVIQIGKAYRNEISPRQAIIRLREFTQAEAEVFFDPDEINEHPRFDEIKKYKLKLFLLKDRESDKSITLTAEQIVKSNILPKFIVYYLARVQQFFESLGIPTEKIRMKEMSETEKPFYTKYAWDCEIYTDSFGWIECVANNYRTDWDLSAHTNLSGEDFTIFKDEKKFIPHVWEISFGVDRPLYCLIDNSYRKEGDRVWLSIPNFLAPVDAAVFPLVAKDGLDKKASEIADMLIKNGFWINYEEKDSIGKRYYREDEAGTPFCITIDYDTMKDNTVTIRNRDTTKQERVSVKDLAKVLSKKLK